MRDGWRVSLDRLPLPLLHLSEGMTPAGCRLFSPKRLPTESEALASAGPKIEAGYGSVVEDPDDERLETDEIRRRLSP